MKSLEICENFHRFFTISSHFDQKKTYILPFKMRFSRLNPLWLLMYLKYTCVAQRCAHTCARAHMHAAAHMPHMWTLRFWPDFPKQFYFEQAEGQARRVKMSRGAKRRARHEKCTRSVTTEAKRGHEKHNRTLTPAHTCDRVKIVRAESAPRMRTPAVSSRARARIYMCTEGAHVIHAPFGCMYPHPKGAV